MSADSQKRAAAEAAIAEIRDGQIVGVGTGSTVNYFIELLAEHKHRIEAAVSSSEASTALLKQIGIPVLDLNYTGDIEIYVDGADEANHQLQLIKGGGAALTREKIVAEAAKRFVCIADASKLVNVLGAFPLPVEVIPMARSLVARKLVQLGGQPEWREGVVTDNGNEILDVHNLHITDAAGLERQINDIPGVVTCGLFARRGADKLIIGTDNGAEVIE